jgi:ketosteroid isomerase-like protein
VAAQRAEATSSGERPLTVADAQQPTTDAERAIWRLIEGTSGAPAPRTDDAVFVSGAYPRPLLVGAQARSTPQSPARDTATEAAAARAAQRRNASSRTRAIRVAVSKSEDMAYGIALFSMAFDRPDSTGRMEHVEFEGTQLTVWRKIGGQWRLAASFNRPNG